jgi:flagellar biosynthesis/type III secretory pathway protein FliH
VREAVHFEEGRQAGSMEGKQEGREEGRKERRVEGRTLRGREEGTAHSPTFSTNPPADERKDGRNGGRK